MNHFEDIVPENRWRNDVLNELREQNRLAKENGILLKQLLERNAQAVEPVKAVKEIKRRGPRRKAAQ